MNLRPGLSFWRAKQAPENIRSEHFAPADEKAPRRNVAAGNVNHPLPFFGRRHPQEVRINEFPADRAFMAIERRTRPAHFPHDVSGFRDLVQRIIFFSSTVITSVPVCH
jgi:hypothetical protein